MEPPPAQGRIFRSQRRIGLADMDAHGRLRLDAVARYLQDVASEDVAETGWGTPDHLWVVRRTRVEVVEPILGEQVVELATWCSGLGASAAGRRTTIEGSGRIEAESVWIHLDADGGPSRIDPAFSDPYGEACGGRRVTTRFSLEVPEPQERVPWPLRAADIDLMAHVNNAAYWQAIEELLPAEPTALAATLEYRKPIDLGEALMLERADTPRGFGVAFTVDDDVRAVASVDHNR